LLKDNVNPNAWGQRGQAPIHEAARYGHIHIIEMLVEWGAKINLATGNGGLTPLHIGVLENFPLVVEYLMNAGAERNLADEDGFTATHKAIQTNNVAITELLLDYDVYVDAADNTGMTPLHCAAFRGIVPVVDALLKRKAAHNAKDWVQQNTALHRAAREGHLDVCKLLIQAKDGDTLDGDPLNPCEIDARDKKGWTPLHYASTNGHAAIVQLLLEGREGRKGRDGAWFETETRNDEIKYDEGGKTPLTLGTQAAAVSHMGPLRGAAGICRKKPSGDIEDVLRKWEYFLIDDDGDGDLTAEEMVAFVRETEQERGAKPFLAKKEADRQRAEFELNRSMTLESLGAVGVDLDGDGVPDTHKF